MNQMQELNKFCEVFEGKATQSDQRFYKRACMDEWDSYKRPLADYKLEVVNAVAVHIPNHRLDDFLSIVVDEQKYLEMEIRAKVPAVKIAYERYRMLLKMCSGDYGA